MTPRVRSNSCRHRPGFTLIEAIATIAVLGVLGSIASAILITASDGYLSAATTGQLHVEASSAMDRMVHELRNIPSTADGPAIQAVTGSSMTWTASGGSYGLALDGSQLRLIDGGSNHVLAENVAMVQIQTFDHAGDLLSETLNAEQCQAIRRVVVTLSLQRHDIVHTLRSGAFIRSTITLSQ